MHIHTSTWLAVQVIMLLLGGFAIAGALSKHNIAKTLASSVLSRVGQGPGLVLLANMLMATFVSMWIRYRPKQGNSGLPPCTECPACCYPPPSSQFLLQVESCTHISSGPCK